MGPNSRNDEDPYRAISKVVCKQPWSLGAQILAPATPWPVGLGTFTTTHCHHFRGEHALHCLCTQITTPAGEKREEEAKPLLSIPLPAPAIPPCPPTNSSASAALARQPPAWSRRW